jgi:hypothetical protein
MLTDLRKNPTSDSSAANRLFDNVSSRIEAIADASTEIAKYTGVTTPIVIKKPSAITGDQVIEIPRMNKSKGGGVTGRAFDRYHSVGVVEEIEGNKILAVIDGSTYYMNAGGRQTINDDSLGPIQVIYTGLEGGKYGFEIAHQK